MSNPVKEKIERLIDSEPFNIIRMKLIKEKVIDEINLMIEDEMKNLHDIETKIMMKEEKLTMKRLSKNLEEFEKNKLVIIINDEIKISKDEKNMIRGTIDCLKTSKPELLDVYTRKNADITDYINSYW